MLPGQILPSIRTHAGRLPEGTREQVPGLGVLPAGERQRLGLRHGGSDRHRRLSRRCASTEEQPSCSCIAAMTGVLFAAATDWVTRLTDAHRQGLYNLGRDAGI